MNPAPDAELASVGEFYHKWIADEVTNLVFKRLNEKRETPRYRWDALLSPEPTRTFAVASPVEQQSRTIQPQQPIPGEPIKNNEARAASAVGETPTAVGPAQSGSKVETGSRTRRETKSETSSKPTARKEGKSSPPRSRTT
jgi:hypothetical protein